MYARAGNHGAGGNSGLPSFSAPPSPLFTCPGSLQTKGRRSQTRYRPPVLMDAASRTARSHVRLPTSTAGRAALGPIAVAAHRPPSSVLPLPRSSGMKSKVRRDDTAWVNDCRFGLNDQQPETGRPLPDLPAGEVAKAGIFRRTITTTFTHRGRQVDNQLGAIVAAGDMGMRGRIPIIGRRGVAIRIFRPQIRHCCVT